jgi:hypothetical protein
VHEEVIGRGWRLEQRHRTSTHGEGINRPGEGQMEYCEIEQIGNPGVRFNAFIDDPSASAWTATPAGDRTCAIQRSNMLIPLRIISGVLAGYTAIGATSSDGRLVYGRGPFQTRKVS